MQMSDSMVGAIHKLPLPSLDNESSDVRVRWIPIWRFLTRRLDSCPRVLFVEEQCPGAIPVSTP